MYLEIIEALAEADSDENVMILCITGAGDYYCSGNDLSNFTVALNSKPMEEIAEEGRILLE
jgi:peroxisomal 3,2-trans-enoyl-CoA isomerase